MINVITEVASFLKPHLSLKFNRHFPILSGLVAVSFFGKSYFATAMGQIAPGIQVSALPIQTALYTLWGMSLWFFMVAIISELFYTQWRKTCMDICNACIALSTGIFLLTLILHNLNASSYSLTKNLLLALPKIFRHFTYTSVFDGRNWGNIFIVICSVGQVLAALISVIRPIISDSSKHDFKLTI